MVAYGTIATWQPVVERTRLRFPRQAMDGWLYTSNTYQNIRNCQRRQQEELAQCLRYFRAFEPGEARIAFDQPAYGGAEFSHIVLPASVPIFVRSGNEELNEALTGEFSSANPAWESTLQVYRWYFAGVTHRRFPRMSAEGWLWVLDAGFRQPESQCPAATQRILDHCMTMDYLKPQQAMACVELGHYPFGAADSALGFLVPVFVKPQEGCIEEVTGR